MKYIVDIHGELEGDYEIIGKYEERPKGNWIDNKVAFYHVCSECGACVTEVLYKIFLCEGELNYCPNCGAQMIGGEE